MKITTIIARSLLGLIFVVFGLNQFLNLVLSLQNAAFRHSLTAPSAG